MSEDMTPPAKGKTTKTSKATGKAKTEASGEKKPRAPRQDWGFRKGAKISLTEKAKEAKFRGQKQEWFDRLQKSNGKTVEHFLENNTGVTNNKGNPEPPRGWLRSFVVEGYAELSGGEEPQVKTGTDG